MVSFRPAAGVMFRLCFSSLAAEFASALSFVSDSQLSPKSQLRVRKRHWDIMFSWGEDSQRGFRLKDGSILDSATDDHAAHYLNLNYHITDLSAGHRVLAFVKSDGKSFIIRTNESKDGTRVRGKQSEHQSYFCLHLFNTWTQPPTHRALAKGSFLICSYDDIQFITIYITIDIDIYIHIFCTQYILYISSCCVLCVQSLWNIKRRFRLWVAVMIRSHCCLREAMSSVWTQLALTFLGKEKLTLCCASVS